MTKRNKHTGRGLNKHRQEHRRRLRHSNTTKGQRALDYLAAGAINTAMTDDLTNEVANRFK